MQFLAGTWWIWLIVALVFWMAAIINQINRMKRMWKSNLNEASDSFFSGIILLVVMWFIGGVSFILFIIGIVFNLLK